MTEFAANGNPPQLGPPPPLPLPFPILPTLEEFLTSAASTPVSRTLHELVVIIFWTIVVTLAQTGRDQVHPMLSLLVVLPVVSSLVVPLPVAVVTQLLAPVLLVHKAHRHQVMLALIRTVTVSQCLY